MADVPFGWRPTVLLVPRLRYAGVNCSHVRRQDLAAAAQPRGKLSRGAVL